MMKNETTKKIIGLLITSIFAGILTNLAHPITALYVKQLHISDTYFGYFLAFMNLGMLFSAPLWGSFGDAKGRKHLFAIGCFLYAIGQVLFGYFSDPRILSAVRFFSGLSAGAIHVSIISYISRSTVLEPVRGKVVSAYISFNIIGSALGSALGGTFGQFLAPNYAYVLYLQGLFLVLFGIIFYFCTDLSDEPKTISRSKNPFASFKDLKKLNIWFFFFLIVVMLSGIAFTNITRYTEKFFTDQGRTALEIGLFNLLIGVVTLITNLFMTPRLQRRYNSFIVTMITALLGSITLVLTFSFSNVFYGFYSIFIVYMMSKAAFEPSSVSFLGEAKEIPSGVLLGVRQSMLSLGTVLGLVAATYFYTTNPYYLFFSCAGLLFLSFIILVILAMTKGRGMHAESKN